MTEQIQIRQNGAAIRALRVKDGWSQRALAARVGVSQSFLHYVEAETKPISRAKLNVIARAMRVPEAAITHRPCPQCENTTADPVAEPEKVAS